MAVRTDSIHAKSQDWQKLLKLDVIGRYALLILVSLVFILPIMLMLMSSLKPTLQLLQDTASFRAFLPVGDLSLDNYRAAFQRVPMGQFVFNSVFVTVVTMVLALIFNSMAAFSFAVIEWRGKSLVLAAIIATFIIPFETIAIPLLMLVNQLPWFGANGLTIGWLNTYHVQIIPFIADSLSIFLFYQYFRDLPKDLIEAAKIDGAGLFTIYRRVFMPISGPVLATVAILKFLAMWNQYLWPLMVVRQESLRPVMVGLQYFFQLNVAWGEVMAYLSAITIPVLLFYLLLQRAFIESIASTGVKG
ncbi:MAG: carbohydrate ABC transporter permease [Anaerolineae bacterium]|nr:carbohydrate ABC transporter permease [Anaerolineae bacterium]